MSNNGSSSDSDEFFDAEDTTTTSPTKLNRRPRSAMLSPSKSETDFQVTLRQEEKKQQHQQQQKQQQQQDNSLLLMMGPPVRAPSASAIHSATFQSAADFVGLEKSQSSRSKLRELRERMQTEDEEVLVGGGGVGGGGGVIGGGGGGSPTGSQADSLNEVFQPEGSGDSWRTSHPFRIIEHDALSLHSLTSLGRIRILSNSQETAGGHARDSTISSSLSSSTSTLRSQPEIREEMEPGTGGGGRGGARHSFAAPLETTTSLQEPDVIASTKGNSTGLAVGGESGIPPVAPPRRRKKNRPALLSQSAAPAVRSSPPPTTLAIPTQHDIPKLTKSASVEEKPCPYPIGSGRSGGSTSLPSPASTIESLTREFEHSLDISSATRGQYVVKPQDGGERKGRSTSRGGRNSSTYPPGGGGSVGGGGGSGCPSAPGSGVGGPPPPGGPAQRERRRSAGDEQSLVQAHNQLNMFVRTWTDSGKPLSDLEILEQVTVLNLDTGERVPLSIAEDKLPQCINPLSLHIMRLTSEYVSNTSLEKEKESDEESVDSKKSVLTCGSIGIGGFEESELGRVRRKTAQIKKFLGSTMKKTMNKAKTMARHGRGPGEPEGLEVVDETTPGVGGGAQASPPTSTGPAPAAVPGELYIKLKASHSHKGPYEFDCLQHVQDLCGEHTGPVWCMKFSSCGRLLATAGQDRVLRIWVVRAAYPYFQDMRTKYNAEKVSPTPSQESLVSQVSIEDPKISEAGRVEPQDERAPFMPKPFCTYSGHTSDLLDVSWSKNYFVLSSSMDKTVRLWHISRRECLCCFQHIDFVTAIVFHPRDDRYFLSGSLDGKLRLWNIPDKKVAVWNELDGPTKLITAANFCQNGKFAVVGSYDGRCIFYTTDQLKYHTQIHVRSTRGKNSTGRKISGIEPMPGEDKILVTSNDSRIRLYDLRDLSLSCKYKGYVNISSQIKASFSHDGKYIVSGSENQYIYIWKSNHDYSKFSSVRRDRNDYWEGIKVHNAVVTCAVFSPNPDIVMRQIEELEKGSGTPPTSSPSSTVSTNVTGYVLVSADFSGAIKVFINKTKPKHSSLPASALA